MGLGTRVRHALAALRGASIYPDPGGGGISLFGSSRNGVNQIYSDDKLLQFNFGWVNAAVMRRANDISTLAVTVELLDKKSNKWRSAPDDPLQRLIARPNAHMTVVDWLSLCEQSAALLGKVTWLIVENPSSGMIEEVHMLLSERVSPIKHRSEFVVGWEYKPLSGDKLIFDNYDPRRPSPDGVSVYQYRVPTILNPYGGNSTVQAAGNSIGLDTEIRAYAKYFFQNNATPATILETDKPYPGVVKARQIREDWEAAYQGAARAGKTAVGWEGLKARTLSPPFRELEFPALARASKMDVLDHFGVPSIILGNDDTGNLGGDATNARRHIYQKHTLNPSRIRHQQALEMLRMRYDERVNRRRTSRVRVESPVEEERRLTWESDKWEYENAIITRGEYRDRRGYEQDPVTADFFLVNKKNNIIPTSVASDPDSLIVLSTSKKDLDKAKKVQEMGLGEDERARVKELKRLFRATFAGEYRVLKDAPLEEKLSEFGAAWREKAPLLEPEKVAQLRAYAVRNFGLVKGYEALKATGAELLAQEVCKRERAHGA